MCVKCDGPLHSPLGHEEVAVHRRSQCDVDASDRVDVAEDEQHGPRHRLEHLHDAVEAVAGHLAHVGRLLATQDVGQTQLLHVDGALQQHLAEQEVLCRAKWEKSDCCFIVRQQRQVDSWWDECTGQCPHLWRRVHWSTFPLLPHLSGLWTSTVYKGPLCHWSKKRSQLELIAQHSQMFFTKQTKSYRWLRYSYKPWSRSTNSALLSGPRLTRTAGTKKHGMTRWIMSDLQNQHPLLVAYNSLLHLSLYIDRDRWDWALVTDTKC